MSLMPDSSMNASYVPDSAPGAVISSGASGKPPLPPTFLASESASVPRVDALGLRAEQRVQVAGVEARDRAVLRVRHDRDAVERDRELDVVDPRRRSTPSSRRPRSDARRRRCPSRPCRRARTRRRCRGRRRSPARRGSARRTARRPGSRWAGPSTSPDTVIDPERPPPVAPVEPVLPLSPALSSSPPQAAAISERASTPASDARPLPRIAHAASSSSSARLGLVEGMLGRRGGRSVDRR